MNWGRVFLGGLVAGVLYMLLGLPVILLFDEQLSNVLEAANMERMSPGLVVLWAVLDILGGITLMWVYAAVRPRLGPGPKTAAIVGLTVWWIALLANMFYIAAGLAPLSTFAIPALYSLVAMVLATIAGAWFYQEGAAPQS